VQRLLLSSDSSARWLLLIHQLPSEPSNLRVRTWRQLQQLGAISIKQAVYVLPESARARENFDRLRTQITDAGGDASLFSASSVDAWSDDALVEAFRRSRQHAYAALARDMEKALRRLRGRRPRTGIRAPGAQQVLEQFRERVRAAERLDFFAAPGRDRVVGLLEQIVAKVLPEGGEMATLATGDRRPDEYRGRLWVTRPRPGVDRMASAWLIRRFIDPDARFAFVLDRHAVVDPAVPFDMSEVEWSHHGELCTFETLYERFGIRDAAVGRIAAIVHDLDLKDDRFGAAETSTIGAVVQGLQLAHAADDALLEHGMALFEALYRSLGRAPGPRGSDFRRKRV
jgi:hypothetical protein